jgi:hypothetical protein
MKTASAWCARPHDRLADLGHGSRCSRRRNVRDAGGDTYADDENRGNQRYGHDLVMGITVGADERMGHSDPPSCIRKTPSPSNCSTEFPEQLSILRAGDIPFMMSPQAPNLVRLKLKVGYLIGRKRLNVGISWYVEEQQFCPRVEFVCNPYYP